MLSRATFQENFQKEWECLRLNTASYKKGNIRPILCRCEIAFFGIFVGADSISARLPYFVGAYGMLLYEERRQDARSPICAGIFSMKMPYSIRVFGQERITKFVISFIVFAALCFSSSVGNRSGSVFTRSSAPYFEPAKLW